MMTRRRRRRSRGLITPAWAPNQLDMSVEEVKPLPGWIILEEEFEQDRRYQSSSLQLEIAQLGRSNTVYGKVVSLPDAGDSELDLQSGDRVIYREWEGGRWSFDGRVVLIMAEQHILATVETG